MKESNIPIQTSEASTDHPSPVSAASHEAAEMASQIKILETKVRELTERNIELESSLGNTERECEERLRASEDFYLDALQQASAMLQTLSVRHAEKNKNGCRIGGRTGRILLKLQKLYRRFRKVDSDAILLEQSTLFDPDYYYSTYPDVAAAQYNPIRHYLEHGWHEMRNPSPLFNTREYLELHPDVKARGINPLIHYLKWGWAENRQVPFAETRLSQIQSDDDDGIFDLFPSLDVLAAACRHAGGSAQNEELLKPELTPHPVLLVSHELTLTGAPIALLNLAKALVRLGKQPVFLSFSDGPMARNEELQRFPLLILPPENYRDWIKSASLLFDSIVINTTVGVDLIGELNGATVPVLWWIHEAAINYNQYIREHWPKTLSENIHVCCDGPLAEKHLHTFFPNIETLQQWYCIYEPPDNSHTGNIEKPIPFHCSRRKIRLGCIGVINTRKGQDILLEAIRILPQEERSQLEVIFVGRKWNEKIYQAIEKAMADFPETIQYIESIPHKKLADFYEGLDALVCPSTDDPGPMVVIEAMMLKKTVICSEHTGFFLIPEAAHAAFWYHNDSPQEVKECISSLLKTPASVLDEMHEKAREVYEKFFSEKSFFDGIERLWLTLEESGSGLQYCPERVSVVIPTWQAGADFPSLLQKLRNQQNLKELEIIIVDSGSTDGTVEIARDAKVKLIKIPHEEFSHSGARNIGIEAAKGKYVLLITQDAMPIGNLWLSRMLQPLLKKEAVAASCRQIPKADCTLFGRFSLKFFTRGFYSKNDRITGMPSSGQYDDLHNAAQLEDISCILDRDLFMQFKYRGNYAEDLDLGLRLLQAGYKLAHLGSTGVAHSHNRTPFYYFRRSLVEIMSVKNLIPAMPLGKLSEKCAVSRIITASFLLKEIRDLFSDKESWGYEELLRLLCSRHEEIQDAVKRDIAYSTDFPIFGRDEKLQGIVSSIWQEYRGKYSYDEDWPTEILQNYTKRLRTFIKSEIYRPNQSWRNELLDFWEQWLGGESGSAIAAFAFFHPNGNTLLNRIMKENQFDV